MIKNYIRSTIIVILQILLPITALLILAPLLINTKVINYLQQPVFQPSFIVLHTLFYTSLILLWTKLVQRIDKQNPINTEQYKAALKVRWYLLALFLFIDVLMLWQSL
ncbi:hypothetical protein LEAN103870_11270 [Legionella anisa]|uniref:Integral membrane protein n=1 Tax=Legionella anisa TaxID=28082 RepID=A0AAX0WWC0_9GAMM|nr:hypothetical protein [Legionella anisa]MDW9132305.1 hypothetical protein [Legionella pneumophila]AWN73407.1 hypothetical protein DLD14_05885 [Legionella anisa]KTC66971.1 hypothetical protein Lani_3316 [Legionella anisa]MBN5934189.1 hypothetical protein [Legionella anisa]MCW8426274.1 hypothetical protein [Legionella anisa]